MFSDFSHNFRRQFLPTSCYRVLLVFVLIFACVNETFLKSLSNIERINSERWCVETSSDEHAIGVKQRLTLHVRQRKTMKFSNPSSDNFDVVMFRSVNVCALANFCFRKLGKKHSKGNFRGQEKNPFCPKRFHCQRLCNRTSWLFYYFKFFFLHVNPHVILTKTFRPELIFNYTFLKNFQ